jgi:hypothetical protein
MKSEAVFRQSLYDFPCPVSLGKYTPSFSLHRYKQGLRFVPSDDEGFTLRGDKQQLVYKGRRRSHRFTILGNTAFEYDCVLEKEPETNIISLRMEGAESFKFFRQPDFVDEPFLKGSYAVYKKETLVGEGTGKLCHIHRPEIIDARGRRCWGELSVVGNELHITIPENWLAEAKYPVVVDPTIGTTTVGSQYLVEYDPPDDPWIQMWFEGQIPVNRFLVSNALNAQCQCTAFLYTNVSNWEGDEYGRPVLYSDNGNKPQTRKSKEEGLTDFHIYRGNPAGWRQSLFKTNDVISSGSYIWFGVFVDFFWEPRFDYGAKCYIDDWYDVSNTIPNTYPIFNVNRYADYIPSMYFTYTAAGQNYQRTLTQGVSLPDSWTRTGNYKRVTAQTVQADATPIRQLSFFKSIQETISSYGFTTRMFTICTGIQDTLNNFDITKKMLSVYARIQETLSGFDFAKKVLSVSISLQDTLGSFDLVARIHSVLSSIKDVFSCFDFSNTSFLHFGNIHDGLTATDNLHHLRNIVRGLVDNVGVRSEGKAGLLHLRAISETVMAVSSVFRGLFLLVRIVSSILLRDRLLGRFLKSKAELSIKSCVSKEITLESRIVGK